jgi:hypothetical protein
MSDATDGSAQPAPDPEPVTAPRPAAPSWRRPSGPILLLVLVGTLLAGMVLGGFGVTAGLVVGHAISHHRAGHGHGWADRQDRYGPGPRQYPMPPGAPVPSPMPPRSPTPARS